MSRTQRRLSKKEGKRLIKKGWNEFKDITDKALSIGGYDFSRCPDRVWENNLYIVQIYIKKTDWGIIEKAMIRKNDESPIHDWKAFQRIKNELFGEERTALEVYPRQSNLVDVVNIYWLWVFPDGFDCPIEVHEGRVL